MGTKPKVPFAKTKSSDIESFYHIKMRFIIDPRINTIICCGLHFDTLIAISHLIRTVVIMHCIYGKYFKEK
jgi:hypothetical protein